jgi:hypothetical protein
MRRAFATSLLLLTPMLLLSGCTIGTPKPKEIPPPFTPTDSREVARVAQEVKIYREDAKLIRNERVTCTRQIAPDLYDQICRPFVTPLAAQQRTHLLENLGQLRHRVGPRCTKALDVVFARPTRKAGPALRRAAAVCQREYRAALTPEP